MSRDWKRLAQAIRAARDEQRLTQKQLAEHAGVSESTIQNLEAGEPRTRTPFSLSKVEQALGWAPGSGRDILAGGEPISGLPPRITDTAGHSPAPAPVPAELPLRIAQELADGPLLDATVLDLSSLGSEARMIVVVRGKPDATPEQIRKDVLAWQRAQQQLDRIRGAAPHDED